MESNDHDPRSQRDRMEAFHRLSRNQRLELAAALFRRPAEHPNPEALAKLRHAFPQASEELLLAGTYHLYTELPGALCDLLAQIELSLRDRDHELHYGFVWEVLYHLYNWLQVQAVVPWGKRDVLDEIREAVSLVKTNDTAGAIGTLERLLEQIGGSSKHPDFE